MFSSNRSLPISISLSLCFILLGLIFWFLVFYLLWLRYTPRRLAFAVDHLATSQVQKHQLPVSLQINELDILLPIVPTQLENSRWQAVSNGVSFLTDSNLPGEVGNSILYGHNWPNLLGNLEQAQVGQTILIGFNDGTMKEFKIDRISVVTPDQTHILNPSETPIVTLYTCTGFLDTKRLVVIAVPTEGLEAKKT